MTGKTKRWARSTLDRLETKANEKYNLSDCPKCGGDMESHLEHYEGQDMVVCFYCEKCNISKLHNFTWCNTEVQHNSTYGWNVTDKEMWEAWKTCSTCMGCRRKINPYNGEPSTAECREAIDRRVCPHPDFKERF